MSSSHPDAAFATNPPTTTLDILARELSKSVFRAARHGLYDKVAVLALRWASDDRGVDLVERKLLHLFERAYRFNVHLTDDTDLIVKAFLEAGSGSSSGGGGGKVRVRLIVG